MKKYFAVDLLHDNKVIYFEAEDNGKAVEYLEDRYFRRTNKQIQLNNHSGVYNDVAGGRVSYIIGQQVGA